MLIACRPDSPMRAAGKLGSFLKELKWAVRFASVKSSIFFVAGNRLTGGTTVVVVAAAVVAAAAADITFGDCEVEDISDGGTCGRAKRVVQTISGTS